MQLYRAFREKGVTLLWFGQATSAIGDEIYRVALTWLAVNLIGTKTGYLTASQSFAFLLFGIFGGHWVDKKNQFKTLIVVDLLRAAIVFIPVCAFYFRPTSIPLLITVAFVVAGLGAFFEPNLVAVVPRLSKTREVLRAVTGIMATTMRLARAVGPTIVGFLSLIIPMIHFFTLDALTFVVSAISISILAKTFDDKRATPLLEESTNFKTVLLSGFKLLGKHPTIKKLLVIKSVAGGLWYLVYSLGVALMVQELSPGNLRAYGLTVAAYGIGNFSGAVITGSMNRSRPITLLFIGSLINGIGFLGMGTSPNLIFLAIASAVTGFGGPVNDIPMVDMIQSQFELHEIPKIFRLRMMGEIFFCLIFTLLSPTLFKFVSVKSVTVASGVFFILFSLYGLIRAENLTKNLKVTN